MQIKRSQTTQQKTFQLINSGKSTDVIRYLQHQPKGYLVDHILKRT